MSTKTTAQIFILIVLIILGLAVYSLIPKENPPVTPGLIGLPNGDPNPISTTTPYADEIHVISPLPNSIIANPLLIKGEARGNWYFEASFPAQLMDEFGNLLAIIPIQAQGEWMTTDFVPFETYMTFSTTSATTGVLLLQNDNPSGLPEYNKSISIPIRFK